MIKEIFLIISSEYLNYYYLRPRTATVVFRSKEIPFRFHLPPNAFKRHSPRRKKTGAKTNKSY